MYKLMQGFAVMAVLTLTLAATAQESPLTKDKINQYIDSLKEMESLSAEINQDGDSAATMAQLWLEGNTSAISGFLEQQEYYPKLKAAVQEAGFGSTQDWVETAQRVTQAYMAVELEEQGQNVAKQVQDGLDEIRNSEQLTEAQKEALIGQLENTQTQLSQIEDVSNKDREAVRPYVDQLRTQFEEPANGSAE